MAELPARIQRLTVPHGRRILVTSDIHGNIPYFEGALKLAGFSARDELIINGDFLEKGSESLRLCRMLMELQKQGNVHVICGNCDDWAEMYLPAFPDYAHDYILRYIKFKRCGLLWDMYLEQGMDPLEQTDFRPAKKLFHEKYPEIWLLLALLLIPTMLFVGVSAGLIILGATLAVSAFSGFSVLADLLLLIGAALVTLALGLLFLWLTVWTIGGGMGGVIRTIGNLHRKLCMKKGVSEE